MKLYFLRHGVAVESGEWDGDDASRPLTSDGRKAMEREAKAFAEIGVDPDRIITSPLTRAKQTAEIVAERLNVKIVEEDRLGSDFDEQSLSLIVRDHGDVKALMLVGHEPDFSRTIGELIGGGRVDLKKGGLARVDLRDASSLDGELVWLLPPKVLTV